MFENDFVNEPLPISIPIRLDAIRFPTRSDSALPTPADFDLAPDFPADFSRFDSPVDPIRLIDSMLGPPAFRERRDSIAIQISPKLETPRCSLRSWRRPHRKRCARVRCVHPVSCVILQRHRCARTLLYYTYARTVFVILCNQCGAIHVV